MKLIATLCICFVFPIIEAKSIPIPAQENKEPPQLPLAPLLSRVNEKRDVKRKETESIADHIIAVNTANHLNLYEGDIVLDERDERVLGTSETRDDVESLGPSPDKRNAIRNREGLWKNKVIPYEVDASLPVEYHSTIQEAIQEFQLHTCLKFVKKTTETNWIKIVHKTGCWSSVGQKYWRTDYGQELSLGVGCNAKGTIIHELMHAVGFWHEQSRPDRNQYVEVIWENIAKGHSHNFNKHGHDMIDRLQIPYDYDSIMHYGRQDFSANGQDTLRPIIDPARPIGQSSGFSPLDIREIETLYDCANKVPGWSSWTGYGPCDLKCKKYRQRFCASDNPSADCPGYQGNMVQIEEATCDNQECFAPIAGHWGRWSSWGVCSTRCGHGTHNRTRSCDDPPPKHGGSDCNGNATESRDCILRRCGLGPDDCQFDYDGFCFWTNEDTNSDDYDWLRKSGPTPSSSTGPGGDHTTGTDHYLYLEASSPAQQGYKARLLSKSFAPTSGRCMSFWYHMYGTSVGELSVYIKEKGGAERKVWMKQGNQGNEWKRARVSITSSAEYQIVIEGVRGRSFNGDIAIDDVAFIEHLCYDGIGCFRDNPTSRALPELLQNLRPQIDWYHIDKTINKCAELAHSKGYKTFGVQFYGECYSGNNTEVHHDKYGPADSNQCWSGVGGAGINYIYMLN